MDPLVQWMLNHPMNEWVMLTGWVWPTAEIVHFIGLSMLLGTMLVIDLRLLGCFKAISKPNPISMMSIDR